MTKNHESDLLGLGQFIRVRRTALGLSQSRLAEQLGWSQERISFLENGKYGVPSLQALVRLAAALDVPLLELIGATGYRGMQQALARAWLSLPMAAEIASPHSPG